jgi:tetratricopeptide (TPR) repeat protein
VLTGRGGTASHPAKTNVTAGETARGIIRKGVLLWMLWSISIVVWRASKARDYDSAIENWKAALSLNPDNAKLRELIGTAEQAAQAKARQEYHAQIANDLERRYRS